MKKTIAAIAAGTLLVASQAYATTEAAPRVGDRLERSPLKLTYSHHAGSSWRIPGV